MDQLSPLIPIEQYAFTKTFSLYILVKAYVDHCSGQKFDLCQDHDVCLEAGS